MKPLTRDQRRESIVLAARELLDERGVESVTMPELSARLGVTRQMLYLHFHSIDDVLTELYQRTFDEYFGSMEPLDSPRIGGPGGGLERLVRMMDLPAPIHRVLRSAYFVEPGGRPALVVLRRQLDAHIDQHWIAPLTANGMSRATAISGLAITVATVIELRELLDRGEISRDEAVATIARILDATFTHTSDGVPGP